MQAIEVLQKCPYETKGHTLEELAKIIFCLVTSDTVYDFMRCIVENFEGLSKDFKKADTDTHYKDPQFFRFTEVSKKYGTDFRGFWRDIDKARRNVGSENSKIVLVSATRPRVMNMTLLSF